MHLFGKKKRRIRGVVDVGSDTIKALVFELPLNHDHPKPLEKYAWDLPAAYSGARLIAKIREGVFHMVRRLEQVPEEILVAIGPAVAEYALQTWRVKPEGGGRMLTRDDIRAYYTRLCAENDDQKRAMIAFPIEAQVNGYPLVSKGAGAGEAILPRKYAAEISFRMFTMHMNGASGAGLEEIKKSLGGLPIEFIPLVVAQKHALASALGIENAFVIDVGGDETALFSVRSGRLLHAAFVPFGVRHFVQALMKKTGHRYPEAREYIRRYGQGMGDAKLRSLAGETVEQTANRWKALFVRSLDSFYTVGPLPQEVMLTGGGARFPELRRALLAPDWLGAFSYASAPSVRVIEGNTFFGGDTLAGHLEGPEDVGIASLMIYSMSRKPLF